MQDEFSCQYRTTCKSFAVMGCMNNFNIINGRAVFNDMGTGCRINSFANDS